MELRWLESFVAVVEELHFGKAGARLGRTQSAVSQHVKKLEDNLGVPLLIRDRHSVTMSDEGRFFYKHAVQILSQLTFATEELKRRQKEEKTILRIGYVAGPCSDLVLNTAREWRKKGSLVQLTEIGVTEIRERLINENLDVVVSPELAPPLPRNLWHESVSSLRVFLAVSPDHHLANQDPCSFQELKKFPFVAYSTRFAPNYRSWILEECQKNGVLPQFSFEANSTHDLLMTVASGSAIAIVPESYQGMARPGTVVFLGLNPEPETLGVWVWSKNSHPRSEVIQQFCASMKNCPLS